MPLSDSWAYQNRRSEAKPEGPLGWINGVAFNPDGHKTIAMAGSDEKTCRIWDAKTGDELIVLAMGHSHP